MTLKPASFGSRCELTEKFQAGALVMAGLTKVGWDYYSVFPLCGKLLNVWDASPVQINGNKELINYCKIMGLNSKEDNSAPLSCARGDSVLYHTKYEQWKASPANNPSAYNVKYYKGLTISDRRERIEYFSNLTRHIICFEPMQDDERQLIDLAFNKKKADACKELCHGESNTYSDFNKELIYFSMADIVCSIPSIVNGLKPGQRKFVFGCFLQPDAEVKVATLTGSITEKVAYHHNFVGANNINLLAPLGQFGTRTQGGKDADAAFYISSRLNDFKTSGSNCYTECGYITKLDDCHFEIMELPIGEIKVLYAKSPLDFWNTDLDHFLKLWEETVEEIQLAFAQSLTEGTSCSNKKEQRITSKLKLKKPLSRSNSTLKLKSKLIQDDSDDQFKGSLSQRTRMKLPSALKPTPKSMAKALALDKPESKPKAALKRKNPKVSDSEEDFKMEATLPTIAKVCPSRQAISKASYVNTIALSSEAEEPIEAEMESVSQYSM
ncbi:DNA topoisomerase 2 [Massospora cicadina]|nr:DNA topoisomerase 2 [Massospora cicadina]